MGDIKEEEEPEGEVVVGPSREAIVHSSGNMLPISLTVIIIIILCIFFFNHSITRWIFILISCADDSESEEEAKVGNKEEEELGILHSWMEMGLPTLDKVEAQKLL